MAAAGAPMHLCICPWCPHPVEPGGCINHGLPKIACSLQCFRQWKLELATDNEEYDIWGVDDTRDGGGACMDC
eukprot:2307545-Rhodomonas_salina.1